MSIDLIKKLRDLTFAPLGDCKEALIESHGDLVLAQDILKKKGAIKAGKKSDRETNAGVVKFVVRDGFLIGVKLLCETDFVAKNDSFIGIVDALIEMLGQQTGDISFDSVDSSLFDAMNSLLRDNAVTIGENMKIDYIIKKFGNVSVYNHAGYGISSAVFFQGSDELLAKDCALQVAAMSPSFVSIEDVDQGRISALKLQFEEELSSSGKDMDIVSKIVEGKIHKSLQDEILLEQVSIKNPSKKIKELFPQNFSILSMVRVSI